MQIRTNARQPARHRLRSHLDKVVVLICPLHSILDLQDLLLLQVLRLLDRDHECELAYITRAGVEVGVASTKAFTTQLAGLFLLTLALAQTKGRLSDEEEAAHIKAMRHLPAALQAVLALEPQIISWAEEFASKENALFFYCHFGGPAYCSGWCSVRMFLL